MYLFADAIHWIAIAYVVFVLALVAFALYKEFDSDNARGDELTRDWKAATQPSSTALASPGPVFMPWGPRGLGCPPGSHHSIVQVA